MNKKLLKALNAGLIKEDWLKQCDRDTRVILEKKDELPYGYILYNGIYYEFDPQILEEHKNELNTNLLLNIFSDINTIKKIAVFYFTASITISVILLIMSFF